MVVNYEESILTYIASIRKYYGLKSSFSSNEHFDVVLKDKKPKQIFLILIDGLGANLINKKLSEDSFLRKNLLFKTTTVYPPTTTAATTSIRNGKAPNENAWLGWSQYFKEIDDIVIPFYGKGFYEETDYGKDFIPKAIPVKTTEEELIDIGINARRLFPEFDDDGCETFVEMCQRLAEYSENKKYDYIYAYWDKYDSLMHKYGPSSIWADHYLNHVNECLEELSKQLADDTMMIVIADHGQIDVEEHVNLYPDYEKYFVSKPALEPRTMAFYVKEDKKEEFEKKFKEDFQDDFILLTHDQVLQTDLFGVNENNKRFEEFIGDYVALAKGHKCLKYDYDNKDKNFKGQHAGILEDELVIPFIVYQK